MPSARQLNFNSAKHDGFPGIAGIGTRREILIIEQLAAPR